MTRRWYDLVRQADPPLVVGAVAVEVQDHIPVFGPVGEQFSRERIDGNGHFRDLFQALRQLVVRGSVKPEGFGGIVESGQAAACIDRRVWPKGRVQSPVPSKVRPQAAARGFPPFAPRYAARLLPVGNAIPLGQFIVLDVIGFQCGPDRHFGGDFVKFPGGHTCGRQECPRIIGISLWSTVSMVCFRTAAGTSATRSPLP